MEIFVYMKKSPVCLFLFLSVFLAAFYMQNLQASEPVSTERISDNNIFAMISINDPIEGYNRTIFEFNDFLMVWIFRPLEKGYSFIIPKSGRKHIDMIILNLEFIIRGISCLLEGEFKGAWVETERFFINLTLGVIGIFDVAYDWFELQPYNEDFGQAFASWGIGPGCYFVLPILGPSTIRDAIGEIFFLAFHPVTWIPVPGIGLFVFVNRLSLKMDTYMSIKDPVLDTYSSMKDLWYIDRKIKIDNLDRFSPAGRDEE